MKYEIIRAILAGIVGGNNEVNYDSVNVYIYRGLYRSIEPQSICYDNGRFAIYYFDEHNNAAVTYLYEDEIKDVIFREDADEIKFVFKDGDAADYGNGRETFIQFFFEKLKNL